MTRPLTRSSDFLIVGDGIAGLSTALALSELGAGVTVVGSILPGAASIASAGLLAPSLVGLPDHVRCMAFAARDGYPQWLAWLREASSVDVPLDRNGILEVAGSEAELDRISARSGQAEVVDAATLSRLEPALAAHRGAVLHPLDGAVDNVALMQALQAAVERAPVRSVHDVVVALDLTSGPPRVQTGAGDRLSAGQVVLASGAWVSTLAGLPRPLPVRPVRGQLLRFAGVPIRLVTYADGGYLIPRGDTLLAGATSEDTGLESRTTNEGLQALRTNAYRTIPALRASMVVDHWAGLRPMTPDGLPILGREPTVPALTYACGFSRNGILLAPYLCGLLAQVLVGGQPNETLDPFSVSRDLSNK